MTAPTSRTAITFAGRRISCLTRQLPDGPQIQPTPRQLRDLAATGRLQVRCLGLAGDDPAVDAARDHDRHDWRPVDRHALAAGDAFRAPDFEAVLIGHRSFRTPAVFDPDRRIIHVPQQGYAGAGWELREHPDTFEDPDR